MSISKEKLELKFSEEYARLNEQQRIAVDTLEGPVMVIAGPGTGKTQILASRIGKILLETDVLPENILCLTYTDAGVVAMRKRLLQFIGPDAYKVNIYTFHAFCNDVIQENLSYFEKTILEPISELEKIQLMKDLIDAFPKNHPLKRYRGDVYFEINNLQSLFSNMKREGWTPAFLDEKINAYIADLPNRDEYIAKRAVKQFKKGDLRTDKIAEETEKMERLRAAVHEFDKFQELMRKRNRYDFDDMINWVIQAFEENPNLLADYQEQFQYILVDEYQDTSGTQNRLVDLLISYWEQPNIFVVGDDDQSIYRFQGANVENMLGFANRYSDYLRKIVLTNNYRSTQPILDVSMSLIDRNQERLVKQIEGLSKQLQSSNSNINHLTHTPEIIEYASQHKEMIGITLQVQQLLSEGVAPGHIGIIYKENKYGEKLTEYFQKLKIPVYSKLSADILQQPIARKLIHLMRYLASEHDRSFGGDEQLFELLHFDWWGVPAIEVAKLSIEAATKNTSGEKISLRELLLQKATEAPKDLFSTGAHEGLKRASQAIEKLISDVPNITLQQLFEGILRETGALRLLMKRPDKHWQLQVVSGLFDFIREATARDKQLDLAKFIEIIDLMIKEDLKMPLAQVSGNDKGVNLLTAHGSKGLEFKHVFFAGCNAGFWEKKRKPGGGYSMPDTLFVSNATANDEEELRRLFYVAITRAEQHLHISFAAKRSDNRDMEPSMFIAEILDKHDLSIKKVDFDAEVMSVFNELDVTEKEPPGVEQMEEEFIGPLIEKFVMNVTALNNYLKCPLEFYYRNLVRIPSPKNEATEFGSAVHFALEKLFRKMQERGGETFPSLTEFIDDFANYMLRHRESFTQQQFDRRMEYGKDVLTNYYNKYVDSFNKIVAIERNIRNVVVKNVPLKGKLDKIEFEGKLANVVDYKTGDPDKALPKLKRPVGDDDLGGDYWRQAAFYKLLVDKYELKDWKVNSVEFDFIEPDKKKNYRRERLVIDDSDIEKVTDQLTAVWQKIQNREFYTGCGKEDCYWCNFVTENKTAPAEEE